MSKPERTKDERPKADVQNDVSTVMGKFDAKAGSAVVHNKDPKRPDDPRRVTVTLENGKVITTDCVDNWQEKLEAKISKLKDRQNE